MTSERERAEFEPMPAEQWLSQCGEFATELRAEVGATTYDLIVTTMDQFAESQIEAARREERQRTLDECLRIACSEDDFQSARRIGILFSALDKETAL